MKNCDVRVEGDKLVVTIDLTKRFGLSSSGKTTIVSTTEGPIGVPGHEHIKLGVNVYTK